MTNPIVKHTAESSGSGKITAKIMREFLQTIPDGAEVSVFRYIGRRDEATYKLSAVWTGDLPAPGLIPWQERAWTESGSMPPR